MSHPDVERELRGFTAEDLRNAIRTPTNNISATQAARGLLSREKRRPVAAAKQILSEAQISVDPKIAAIKRLGRTTERGAQQLLIEQLDSQDPAILRATIWSLAKVGDADTVDELKKLERRSDQVVKAHLTGALRLAAFRNGIDGFGFARAAIPAEVRLPSSGLRQMQIKPLDVAMIRSFESKIIEDAPGLGLSIDGGTEVNCLGKPLWLLPSKQAANNPKSLIEKPAVPIAIYSFDECSGAPYLKAYVLSEPRDNGIDFYVTRMRGQITHRGKASVNGEKLNVDLRALDTRFDPASRIVGTFSGNGVLEVESAQVSENFKRQLELRQKPKLTALQAIRTEESSESDPP